MRAVLLSLLALLLPIRAYAFDVGPPVGSTAPALQATDAAGRRVTVRSLSGSRGLVLVFFRSAKWCPYCQRQLIDFRDAQAPLEARGYRLAALSYDPPEVTADFAARRQIGYAFLSDPNSATIDAFMLRDPQYQPGHFAYGVPRPAIFVISRTGVIQAKLAEEGFKVRPSVEAVLKAVDALSPGSQKALR